MKYLRTFENYQPDFVDNILTPLSDARQALSQQEAEARKQLTTYIGELLNYQTLEIPNLQPKNPNYIYAEDPELKS